jgi:hypothetical protein
MENSLEKSSNRQIKRVLIILAVVEFIVTVFGMFYVVKR